MPKPEISVLMPIWNEERWLETRIKTILSQTYDRFELIITDNASTDSTEEICRRFSEQDHRIRYIRHATNLGASKNFVSALSMAQCDYIAFAGGHDTWSQNFLETLKDKLDSNTDVVLAFGRTEWIDYEGEAIKKHRGLCCTEGVSSPIRRFNIYMWADQNPIYGMMRKDATLRAWVNEDYIAGGQIFLQRMAILGQFAHVPDATFYRRQNRPNENRNQRLSRYQKTLFDKRGGLRRRFWRSAFAIVKSAAQYPLPESIARRRQLRFLLVASSLGAFVRFWPNLWRGAADQ